MIRIEFCLEWIIHFYNSIDGRGSEQVNKLSRQSELHSFLIKIPLFNSTSTIALNNIFYASFDSLIYERKKEKEFHHRIEYRIEKKPCKCFLYVPVQNLVGDNHNIRIFGVYLSFNFQSDNFLSQLISNVTAQWKCDA